MRKLPPLSTLRLFDAAGRHLSFKLAAEELNITPGAVSHGIASLESWIGVPLFERTPCGLILSAAGRDYLPYISEALGMVATGTHRLPSRDGSSPILVSVTPTFAKHLLIPRLPRFRERQPQASVTLDTRLRQVNLPADGIDFAIRMGRGPVPGLRSTELLRERLVPVCSPAYRAGLPAGGLREILSAAILLHVDTVSEDWTVWLEQAGLDGIEPGTAMHFDMTQLAVDAAAAGLGIAIGRRPLVDNDLADGRVVIACAPELPAATGYWLISHPDAGRRADLVDFEQWLVAEMQEVNAPAPAR